MANTSDTFLSHLKSRARMPASQALLSDADFLATIDKIILGTVVPLIEGLRQEFFVVTENVTLVDGQNSYAIPYRSKGRALRDLRYTNGTDETDMCLVLPEEALAYASLTGNPEAFYFKNDKVIILPTPTSPSASDQLVMDYPLYPNRLCLVSAAACVQSVSNDTITFTSVPNTMVSGVLCDLIQGAQGNATLAKDLQISAASGNQLVFPDDSVPDGVVAGDYVSLAQTSPVIQLPDVCESYLETAVCLRLMQDSGDFEAAQGISETLREEEKALRILLQPRVKGENTIVVNHPLIKRPSKGRYGWLFR